MEAGQIGSAGVSLGRIEISSPQLTVQPVVSDLEHLATRIAEAESMLRERLKPILRDEMPSAAAVLESAPATQVRDLLDTLHRRVDGVFEVIGRVDL